jgi:transcriptional regulator GlxA family with amidase domain
MAKQPSQHYCELVDRFEKVARENIGRLTRVADVCRIGGFNQRTLSRAFREVRETTPYRCLQDLRLREVKRILSSEEGTVTQAAMQFGFREAGRFSAQYRKAFGESPSETKRQARARRAASPSSCSGDLVVSGNNVPHRKVSRHKV